MRRLAVAGAVAALSALLVVAPAHAAAPQGGVVSPEAGAVLSEPTAAVTIRYTQQSGRVDRITARLVALKGQGVPAGSSAAWEPGTSPAEVVFQLPTLSRNGPYEIQTQATGTDNVDVNGPETSAVAYHRISFAVPPATPTGLSLTPDRTTQTVGLSWSANAEPDLVGYLIERAFGDGAFKEAIAAGPQDTAEVDEVPQPGEWRYRITAIRYGASGDASGDPVVSAASASRSTTVQPPPATTTTTSTTVAGSGSGSGGGTGGDDSGGGGTGSTGSGSSPSSGGSTKPVLDRRGRVDLSSFQALLEQNRRNARSAQRPSAPPEVDPGFDELLPFRGQPDAEALPEPEGDQAVVFERVPLSDDADASGGVGLLGAVAGSLLLFVMAMQLWWVRGEVNRSDLEVLDHEDLDDAPDGGEAAGAGADLDVGDESTARTEDGLPPGPGDDRAPDGAAVRARRRRDRRSDRSPAVG